MDNNNQDIQLEKALKNKTSSRRLIKNNGTVIVPGTPFLVSSRGASPKTGEYLYPSSEDGIVTDPNQINILKERQSVDVLQNEMLGQFNDSGIYSVNKEISTELIYMVKVVTKEVPVTTEAFYMVNDEKVTNISPLIFCESASTFSGMGNFRFAIQNYTDGKSALSELFLLEEITKVGGFVGKTNVYTVGKYKGSFSKEYKREMFEYFNVVNENTALKMSEEQKLLFGWAYRRKLYLKTLKQLANTRLLLVEANYFSEKLEILAELGPFGTQIISTFKDLQRKAEQITNTKLNAKDLNDLLDMVIDEVGEKAPNVAKSYYETIQYASTAYGKEIRKIEEENAPKAKKAVVFKSSMPTVEGAPGKAYKMGGPAKGAFDYLEQFAPKKSKDAKKDGPKKEAFKQPIQKQMPGPGTVVRDNTNVDKEGSEKKEVKTDQPKLDFRSALLPKFNRAEEPPIKIKTEPLKPTVEKVNSKPLEMQ